MRDLNKFKFSFELIILSLVFLNYEIHQSNCNNRYQLTRISYPSQIAHHVTVLPCDSSACDGRKQGSDGCVYPLCILFYEFVNYFIPLHSISFSIWSLTHLPAICFFFSWYIAIVAPSTLKPIVKYNCYHAIDFLFIFRTFYVAKRS